MTAHQRARGRIVSNSKNNIAQLDFEQALAQLNSLVEKLESGELPLEDSVAAFESGVQLSRRCEALLDTAEQRLQVLGEDQGR
ncbi:MAG: exodeoxyribonuclease VII small subunit [Mariprofundaceae bacterium]